jgi:hypothetical protein
MISLSCAATLAATSLLLAATSVASPAQKEFSTARKEQPKENLKSNVPGK